MSSKAKPSELRRTSRRTMGLLLVGGGAGAAAAAGTLVVIARGRSVGASPDWGSEADTVTVDKPLVDLGRVPLNATVPVSVMVTNRSARVITLGRPTAEALEGC